MSHIRPAPCPARSWPCCPGVQARVRPAPARHTRPRAPQDRPCRFSFFSFGLCPSGAGRIRVPRRAVLQGMPFQGGFCTPLGPYTAPDLSQTGPAPARMSAVRPKAGCPGPCRGLGKLPCLVRPAGTGALPLHLPLPPSCCGRRACSGARRPLHALACVHGGAAAAACCPVWRAGSRPFLPGMPAGDRRSFRALARCLRRCRMDGRRPRPGTGSQGWMKKYVGRRSPALKNLWSAHGGSIEREENPPDQITCW